MTKAEYYKQWREKNREKVARDQALYREVNRDEIAEKKRAYYLANREKFIAKAKERYDKDPQSTIQRANEWNKENVTKRKQILQKWSRNHPEHARKHCANSRAKYPDYHKKRLAEWKKKNPALVRKYCTDRRARILGSAGEITVEQVADLYQRQGGKCAACKKALNMQYQLDHVMPLSLGGEHKIENAEILCRKCNQQKHAMHPDEWAARLGKLFV